VMSSQFCSRIETLDRDANCFAASLEADRVCAIRRKEATGLSETWIKPERVDTTLRPVLPVAPTTSLWSGVKVSKVAGPRRRRT